MREVKIPEGKERPIIIKCLRCHCRTLRLVRKAWEENPFRGCNELRGYYGCKCGYTCSKVFANEKLKTLKGLFNKNKKLKK